MLVFAGKKKKDVICELDANYTVITSSACVKISHKWFIRADGSKHITDKFRVDSTEIQS